MTNSANKLESIDRAQRNTKIWLVISQLIAAVVLVAPFLAILTIFPVLAIASPEFTLEDITSGVTIWQIIVSVGALFIGPAVAIPCAVIAWRSFNQGLYRRASIVTTVPIAYIVLAQIVLPFLAIVIGSIFFGYRG